MNAWLWPQSVKSDPRWNARLGRVVHWSFAAVAGACGAFAVVYLWVGLQTQAAALSGISTWEARHLNDRPTYRMTRNYQDYYVADPGERGIDAAGRWLDDKLSSTEKAANDYAPPSIIIVPTSASYTPKPDYGFKLLDERPQEAPADWATPLISSVIGAIIALFGRGLRYILGGE